MSIAEMAVLLAEIQVGDNRNVDELTIAYWHNTIGDLDLPTAQAALRRFRRERPGTYLEPGHLLELAGVVEDPDDPMYVDYTEAWAVEAWTKSALALGYTPDQLDDERVRREIDRRLAAGELEAGASDE